ncbi:transglycosylase domain-containing protein [Aureimonas frigidaquae]|uniref:Penicillin-binding protein n=1 Tax=Aureimonas frigidaquae TaxID=424757 RepID=A0A0P0Z1U8_9HYPH|nr:transglycosylase domain-containing protein [Aureimonas frigidaquae]BAT27656.1 penicillin-binding protein [Aureimonas frigidaquae]
MGLRRKEPRIEPTFGQTPEGSGGEGFRLSADDRAVPQDRAPRRERVERKAPRRRGGGDGNGGGSGNGGGRGGGRSSGGRRRRSPFARLAGFVVMLGFWAMLAGAAVIGYFALTLPQEAWVVPDRPPNVRIVSVTGDLLANRGVTGGEALALDQISPYLPQAVMAIEDRRFYQHFGVDPIGIIRALTTNLQAGGTVQGGSTLTQQLAKNIFLTPEQKLTRKIQEAILALWLEQRFSKDQILEMYLNRVYFGSGATGAQAAARRYFDKDASELTLSQSAMLAGLLKAPSELTPVRNPEAAKARADVVLGAMLEAGFITQDEYKAALAEQPTEARSFWTGGEHYAADMVMRDLKGLVGDDIRKDVIVETTIDLPLEKAAEKAIRDTIDHAKQNVTQGALVSIDGTGAIRAIIGGRDYAESQFNRAVDARRQPGSAFKPFVYETALEFGWRPESMMMDQPVRIGNWTPSNYDNKFRGPVTMAQAVAHSLNTTAAALTAELGPKTVIETATSMGITSPMEENASIALGTSEVSLLELTGAFAPFANGGYRATPHLVNRVTTVDGEVLYERPSEVPPMVITADIAGMMNAMLTGVVTSGTGRRAQLDGWQVAGKSGTTQDFKDAWFIGYTANLTTGVWLGNDNGKPMRQVTGGSLPAEAWKAFMVTAHEGLPPVPLPGDYRIGDHQGGVPMASAQPQAPAEGIPAGGGGEPPRATYVDEYGNLLDQYGRMMPNQPPSQAELDRSGGVAAPAQDSAAAVAPPPGAPAPHDPYGDGTYGGAPPEYGAPADYGAPPRMVLEGPARVIRQDELPPDAVLEGPAQGGRATDRSLFRGLFGG